MSNSLNSMFDNGTTRGECRRGFFRVTSRLPIRLTPLDEEAVARLTQEINAPGEVSTALGDHQLEMRLCKLEQKLDQLLVHAGLEVELPVSKAERLDVELSGSGLRVQVNGSYCAADRVRVELSLPEENGRAIRLLGRIVTGTKRTAPAEKPEVALVYQLIRDRDREAIVRHAYEVQRLELGRASRRDSVR